MIKTREIKVRKPKEFRSEYFEEKFKEMGLDVLRWAITGYDEDSYIIDIAIVQKP